MVTFVTKDKKLLGLGLSDGNIKRLKEGKTISLDLKEIIDLDIDMKNYERLIFNGKDFMQSKDNFSIIE